MQQMTKRKGRWKGQRDEEWRRDTEVSEEDVEEQEKEK